MMSNEAIYDELINPLMSQVIALCKTHGIPMYASFQLEPYAETTDPLYVSTSIPGNDASPRMIAAQIELARHKTD
jgi:hypothetical protein